MTVHGAQQEQQQSTSWTPCPGESLAVFHRMFPSKALAHPALRVPDQLVESTASQSHATAVLLQKRPELPYTQPLGSDTTLIIGSLVVCEDRRLTRLNHFEFQWYTGAQGMHPSDLPEHLLLAARHYPASERNGKYQLRMSTSNLGAVPMRP